MNGLAVAGPTLTLAVMSYLQVGFAGAVSPTHGLISDYAWLAGAGPLFALGVLSLAAGSIAVAYGLAQVERSRSVAARALLMAASAALVLTALFPTDRMPGMRSLGGDIHRWSVAVVFTGLPGAGWILARQTRELPGWRRVRRRIRLISVVSVLALAAFLLCHPGSPVAELIGGPGFYGLLERLVVLVEIVLVLAMAVPARLAWSWMVRKPKIGRGLRKYHPHRDARAGPRVPARSRNCGKGQGDRISGSGHVIRP
ncbi:DUF998 domain-containing protein [Sphaerisporangium perillae]|uniref:DUF998 domain-containing protein n=1 Tax=Sphaerisporangium perillae TaxID=2935860 RepID=UPI00200D48E3|nr:DUF998 domain-containing protein [Sphaerisporangium perillae]